MVNMYYILGISIIFGAAFIYHQVDLVALVQVLELEEEWGISKCIIL